MAKILFITDYPHGAISGYATICKPLCNGLVDLGHEVKLLAFSNHGEEHWEKFAIIPVEAIQEAQAAIHNLGFLWKPDVIVSAMDIPSQDKLYSGMQKPDAKYIAITPMENGPLMLSWAMGLSTFDKVLFISQLGEDEARKVGLQNVGHLLVGIDYECWQPAKGEERDKIRKNLGFGINEKVILTVADNQERKNLWAGMAIVAKIKQLHPEMKLHYLIVTRDSRERFGWSLQELANSMGLQNEYVEFTRGMPQEQLRLLYLGADAFLLPSKAEGLGLPVLEALATELNCVCTDTGAMTEVVKDRGWLVPPDYTFIDVWGNSKRDMISIDKGAEMLYEALQYPHYYETKDYVLSRSWENMVKSFDTVIKEVTHA